MVFHDSVLTRICNKVGKVRQFTAIELAGVEVGGTSDTIPSFQQLLKQVDGQSGLVVELKEQSEGDTEDFARAVLECLSGYDGATVLMSFDHALLTRAV